TVYETLDEAEADYASGGYVDCEGGPNCRGTVVAIYPEQNPVGGEGPLGEAEPAYVQPGEGGEPAPPEETLPPEPEPAGGEAVAEPITDVAQIETAADATSFLEGLGIPAREVEWGDQIEAASTAKYKPGSQGEIYQEDARTIMRGTARAVAEMTDTFGPSAMRVDAVRVASKGDPVIARKLRENGAIAA